MRVRTPLTRIRKIGVVLNWKYLASDYFWENAVYIARTLNRGAISSGMRGAGQVNKKRSEEEIYTSQYTEYFIGGQYVPCAIYVRVRVCKRIRMETG